MSRENDCRFLSHKEIKLLNNIFYNLPLPEEFSVLSLTKSKRRNLMDVDAALCLSETSLQPGFFSGNSNETTVNLSPAWDTFLQFFLILQNHNSPGD